MAKKWWQYRYFNAIGGAVVTAKFPNPPTAEALALIKPVVLVLPAATVISRLFSTSGRYPANWNEFRHVGPLGSRFDHHLISNPRSTSAAGKSGAFSTAPMAQIISQPPSLNTSRVPALLTVEPTALFWPVSLCDATSNCWICKARSAPESAHQQRSTQAAESGRSVGRKQFMRRGQHWTV